MLKIAMMLCACLFMLCSFINTESVLADTQKSSSDDTLVYAWSTHVGPLDAHDYGANMMFAQAFVYEPLLQYGKNGTLLPALATKWTVSEDKKTYTFTLRQGVRFSDGEVFDAAAVVKNFDAIFANKIRHSWMTLIERIQSYKAEDAHTFSITLHKPYAATLQDLTFVRPLRFMSPKALQAKEKNKEDFRPVGTGPWIWQERSKGQYDLFVRNENYWNKKEHGENFPKKLMVKVIPDAEARAVALETGAIDILATAMGDHGTAEISLHSYGLFAKDTAKYITLQSEARNTRFIALNSGRSPLNDLKVRKAIMRAVDRHGIVQRILLGQELPAEQLMHTSLPYSNIQFAPYVFDVAKANSLLDEAGWKQVEGKSFRQKDGKDLSLTLKFVAHESLMRTIAQVVQSDLARVGIELKLVGQEGVAFMESQRVGDFDLIFGNSSGAPYVPFSYLGIMQVEGHPEYQAQRHIAAKKELDMAMERALQATEEAEIQQAFADIWRILHEAEVYMPLSFTVDKALYRKEKLKGFSFSPVSYELYLQDVEKIGSDK